MPRVEVREVIFDCIPPLTTTLGLSFAASVIITLMKAVAVIAAGLLYIGFAYLRVQLLSRKPIYRAVKHLGLCCTRSSTVIVCL